jgi:hypothetical protein
LGGASGLKPGGGGRGGTRRRVGHAAHHNNDVYISAFHFNNSSDELVRIHTSLCSSPATIVGLDAFTVL